MELSIPVETTFVSSNVTDTTTAYNKNTLREFINGEILQDQNFRWVRTGDTFTPPTYSINDVANYNVGDVVYKDGLLKYVTDLGIVQTKKMPPDYIAKTFTTMDATVPFRYIHLGHLASVDRFTATVGGYAHELYADAGSVTGWYYTVVEVADLTNILTTEPIVYKNIPIPNGDIETESELLDYSNQQFAWASHTCVIIGQEVYSRTMANSSEIEYNTTYNPTFAPLDNLNTIGWGWTKQYPITPYMPFDGKNYTKLESTVDVITEFSSTSTFNTIAITGLIASTVKIESTASTINYSIDNRKDVSNRLGASPITTILYLDRDIVGTVKLTVTTNNGVVEIGEILSGLSVNAGFTNLEFSNEYKDYSPTEIDQWGNVEYISGTKVNIHSGSVDMKTTNYDMINRLITSIGGSKVILNGSGNKDNLEIATEGVFSSTMIVGRITSFSQRTKIKDGDLDKMSNYTFKIEELV